MYELIAAITLDKIKLDLSGNKLAAITLDKIEIDLSGNKLAAIILDNVSFLLNYPFYLPASCKLAGRKRTSVHI